MTIDDEKLDRLNLEAKAFDEDIKVPSKKEPETTEKKVPYATQMRIEKAEEEAMYAKRGDVALKNYCRNLEDIAEVALEEFNLQFHSYLSLARRRQVLEDMRNKRAQKLRHDAARGKKDEADNEDHFDSALDSHQRFADERLKKALEDSKKKAEESKKLEQQLRDRDKEIERLHRRLEKKTPKQKAFERRVHRKQRRAHGLNNINSIFQVPFIQKVAGKLFEVDKAVSDFLLDIGNAEYVITKENLVSTAARKFMNVRAVDEPEYFVDPSGDLVTKWAYLMKGKSPTELKKTDKASFLDLVTHLKKFSSNG